MQEIIYKPIGVFKSPQTQPVDSPRQGSLAEENKGVIELNKDFPLESLTDLEGFERLWVVYDFHLNKAWKPMVRPPRGADKKRGVFATRSPYRPNSIGISCVRLEKIERGKVFVTAHDLLDGTPVLDIKPYLPYSDSFPESKTGWLGQVQEFDIFESENFKEKLIWLEEKLQKPLGSMVRNQLGSDPTNGKIKRVKPSPKGYCLSYRTWRIDFEVSAKSVKLLDLRSGYSHVELIDENDPYGDKSIHKSFLVQFS